MSRTTNSSKPNMSLEALLNISGKAIGINGYARRNEDLSKLHGLRSWDQFEFRYVSSKLMGENQFIVLDSYDGKAYKTKVIFSSVGKPPEPGKKRDPWKL